MGACIGRALGCWRYSGRGSRGRMRLLSNLKTFITSPEPKPRRILAGPFRGIVMGLSLRSQAQLYAGLFERETHPWLNRLSMGISAAIDIGVGHGEHTIYFLTKTRATKVFAFEPDVTCIPFLRENLELNGVGRSDRLEIFTRFVGASATEQQ